MVLEDDNGDYDVEEGNDMDAEGEDEDGAHDAKRRRIELTLHLENQPPATGLLSADTLEGLKYCILPKSGNGLVDRPSRRLNPPPPPWGYH